LVERVMADELVSWLLLMSSMTRLSCTKFCWISLA
jgi:hypothetical protein